MAEVPYWAQQTRPQYVTSASDVPFCDLGYYGRRCTEKGPKQIQPESDDVYEGPHFHEIMLIHTLFLVRNLEPDPDLSLSACESRAGQLSWHQSSTKGS